MERVGRRGGSPPPPFYPRCTCLGCTLTPFTAPLLQAHASQLTRLTVVFGDDRIPALTLPLCRSLKLVGLPALTSVKCDLGGGPDGLPLESLRTFVLPYDGNAPLELARCTGLRRLTFWGLPPVLSSLPPLPTLRALSMHHCTSKSQPYREFIEHLQCTALASLKIDHSLGRELLAAWPFPRLCDLTLVGPHDAADVLPYLDAAPRLTSLRLHITGGIDEEILPLLASKGLEEVSLTIYTYDDFADLIADLRARPYPWMKVTVDVIEP